MSGHERPSHEGMMKGEEAQPAPDGGFRRVDESGRGEDPGEPDAPLQGLPAFNPGEGSAPAEAPPPDPPGLPTPTPRDAGRRAGGDADESLRNPDKGDVSQPGPWW